MDKQTFALLVGNLAADYRIQMEAEELRSWWNEFQNVDENLFRQVLHNLSIGRGRPEAATPFMPKKSEVCRAIALAKVRPVADAWDIVISAIGHLDKKDPTKVYGRDNRPTFHDPLIERAVRATGWRRINDEESVWVRKDFEKHYLEAIELNERGQLSQSGEFLMADQLKKLVKSE